MKLILVFLFSLFALNDPFPSIQAENIDNKTISLPEALKGKYSLLCFAGSNKAQKDLESWLDPVYQKYIAKTGLMDDMFDVNVFFIPFAKGPSAALLETFKKRIREEAQADLKPHVLFLKSDINPVLTALNITSNDTPYLFVLDANGTIVYRITGGFSEAKWDQIDDKIE